MKNNREHLAANISRRFLSDMGFKKDWSLLDIAQHADLMAKNDSEHDDFVVVGKTFLDWQKSRQVYRFEPELARELLDAPMDFAIEDLNIPFSSLYIDLNGCNVILDSLPVHGIYVSVITEQQHSLFFAVLAGNAPSIIKGALVLGERLTIEEHIRRICGDMDGDEGVTRLLLSLLSYISSDEPDIQDKGKKRYLSREQGRKGISEVREWDVGFRFVKEKKRDGSGKEELMPVILGRKGTHASPRAHIRKGHWHTYWCGTGRQERKVKWIRETKVGKGNITTVVREMDGKGDVYREGF